MLTYKSRRSLFQQCAPPKILYRLLDDRVACAFHWYECNGMPAAPEAASEITEN